MYKKSHTEYADRGFSILRGFLNEQSLQELRFLADTTITVRKNFGMLNSENRFLGSRYSEVFGDVFDQYSLVSRDNPDLRKFSRSAQIGSIVSQVTCVQNLRAWNDKIFIKNPSHNATPAHVDGDIRNSWTGCHKVASSMWLALDHADENSGCLYFYEGSHKFISANRDRFDNSITSDILQLFPEIENLNKVTVPVSAGDCIIHNAFVVHGAHSNESSHNRRAFIASFIPNIGQEAFQNHSIEMLNGLSYDEAHPVLV